MVQLTAETNADARIPVVGIGASAGGIEALSRFLDAMPAESGCAFVIVLHLDPKHDSELAHILGAHSPMPVVQVTDDMPVAANHVYVIAPNTDLLVSRGQLVASTPAKPRGQRYPVDGLFTSLAKDHQERAIAIVLSGTGRDGTEGLRDIRAAGGISLVQSPETAQFDGMPRSAIAADLADHVLAPEDMPATVLHFIGDGFESNAARIEDDSAEAKAVLTQILEILRAQGGHDFRHYKLATLKRRINRRVGLKNIEKLEQYLELLRTDPVEVTTLVSDLMISVTGFFRDTEAWQCLAETVLAPMIAARETGATIRIWVPACATGEEAYSLAILVTELAEAADKYFDLRVFATDAQQGNLRTARDGIYGSAALTGFDDVRLARFFEKVENSWQVNKELRDKVVFAPHNLLRDPPFSRLDLVSCRNFLIYLEQDAQQRIIALFHFALCVDGHLFLGNAETIGRHDNLFETVSKKHRIFRRLGPTRHDLIDYPQPRSGPEQRPMANPALAQAASLGGIASQALLEHFTPASVLIDQKYRVVYIHGKIGDYVEIPPGEPTRDLLTMVRSGLAAQLRAAMREAMANNSPVTAIARLRDGQNTRSVDLTVTPLQPSPQGSFLLVSFRTVVASLHHLPLSREDEAIKGRAGELALLEELKATREELQDTIKHHETTNEELKASNEEAVSMNEELQSTNEELETSKEELQSFNEELNTVNSQLQHKIGELETTTNDLNNLLAGSEIAILFLDSDLCIRWFAPAMRELFSFVASDIGRPIADLARKFMDDTLLEDLNTVVTKLATIEVEIKSDAGLWYVRRVLPYRTQDNRIAGVVVTFNDISDRKHAADAVNDARLYAETIVRTVQHPLLVLDHHLRVRSANKAFRELFSIFEEEPKGQVIFELGSGEWNNPPLRNLLERVLSEDEEVHNFEIEQDFRESGQRSMLLTACRLTQEGSNDDLILIAIEDVTERKRFELHREILIGELNHRIKNVMATVQAVASQTFKSATTMAEARATFSSRLIALAKSHDLLTQENWAGADLSKVVANAVGPHGLDSKRIRISGPHLRLIPGAALSLAMALHELATNAAKYGALSNDGGTIDITWSFQGQNKARRLLLTWAERGGPPVAVPTRKGFGSRMVQQVLAMELGGKVNVNYAPTGVVCLIDVPMPADAERGETG